jgi:hypothetical protein
VTLAEIAEQLFPGKRKMNKLVPERYLRNSDD